VWILVNSYLTRSNRVYKI